MRCFWIFFKKECKEHFKNYKLLLLGSIFLFFAILSPITAKIMPELFASVDLGVDITIPDSTFTDSYVQFFKNFNSILPIVLILLFSGNISGELNRGSTLLLFAKGLSRTAFLMAKFCVEAVLMTVGYLLSVVVFWGYTQVLFPDQNPQQFFLSMFCLWLFFLLLLAVMLLASTLFRQSFQVMLTVGAFWVILIITGLFPNLEAYTPNTLSTINMDFVTGTAQIDSISKVLIIAILCILLCLISAPIAFRRKKIV